MTSVARQRKTNFEKLSSIGGQVHFPHFQLACALGTSDTFYFSTCEIRKSCNIPGYPASLKIKNNPSQDHF
jgi:hypothetical protein